MARHSSASSREETSTQPEETSNACEDTSHTIDASLKRRARLLTTNRSIPPQTRNLIRYALEMKDPYLGQLVRRVEAGEVSIEHCRLSDPEGLASDYKDGMDESAVGYAALILAATAVRSVSSIPLALDGPAEA